MTIEVTQEDIDRGVPCDECNCPIAIALRRTTGETWDVTEHEAISRKDLACIDLPRKAKDFIHAFDSSDFTCAHPFTFEGEIQS